MSEEYDVIIKNSVIVDGTGAPSFRGEVAVRGDRIAEVADGTSLNGDAKLVSDGKGLALTPGLVDVHNHVDLSILYYPKCESFVRQGITSFVGGHCGDSTGPYGDLIGEPWFLMDLYEDVRPSMYRNEWQIPKELLNPRHKEVYGWEIDWGTMGQFFKHVEDTGHSINFSPLVGHGDIRTLVMGTDYKRKATDEEIEEMVKHTRQAMDDGCIGVSVGRTYVPGNYASFEEVLACAKVAAEYGGIYTSHCLRSDRPMEEGKEPPVNPIAGPLEAIDVARKAGLPVQISHLMNGFVIQPAKNRMVEEATVKATLKIIDDAQEEGLDVNFDVIPHHNTGGIFTSPWLAGILNPWLKLSGSLEQFSENLKKGDLRKEIKARVNEGKMFMLNPKRFPDWAEMIYVKQSEVEEYVDKSLDEIAKEMEKEPLDALMDVLMADPGAKYERIREKDDWAKLEFYKHPAVMIGCDTFAVDDKEVLRHPSWFFPNQNAFGGMLFYLRRTVRETKALTLEEAIRKITSQSARKHLMKDRGTVKVGAFADLVLMEPETASDMGDQLEPRRYPTGIEHVFVNGVQVVKKNQHTDAMPGRILYRE